MPEPISCKPQKFLPVVCNIIYDVTEGMVEYVLVSACMVIIQDISAGVVFCVEYGKYHVLTTYGFFCCMW